MHQTYNLLMDYSEILTKLEDSSYKLSEYEQYVVSQIEIRTKFNVDFDKFVEYLKNNKNKVSRDHMIGMNKVSFDKVKINLDDDDVPVAKKDAIAGFIDALTLGWITGMFGSILFSLALYIWMK